MGWFGRNKDKDKPKAEPQQVTTVPAAPPQPAAAPA